MKIAIEFDTKDLNTPVNESPLLRRFVATLGDHLRAMAPVILPKLPDVLPGLVSQLSKRDHELATLVATFVLSTLHSTPPKGDDVLDGLRPKAQA